MKLSLLHVIRFRDAAHAIRTPAEYLSSVDILALLDATLNGENMGYAKQEYPPHPHTFGWPFLGQSLLTFESSWEQSFVVPTVYFTHEESYAHLRIGWLPWAIGIAWPRNGYRRSTIPVPRMRMVRERHEG